ncbi:MAG: universal stress protein [Candidatus Binatia bacterium]
MDLDRAFLRSPETAKAHVEEILKSLGDVEYSFFEPSDFTASTLPEIPPTFGYMCCPRTISDLSTKISLGYIGPRVRSIIEQATFPILIPAASYKPWENLLCFFGGSPYALNVAECAIDLSEASHLPLKLFTEGEGKGQEWYQSQMKGTRLSRGIQEGRVEWMFFEKGDLKEHLYDVPHDALIVIGSHGHKTAKELFFGSKTELVQTVLPNPMVVIGPNFRAD